MDADKQHTIFRESTAPVQIPCPFYISGQPPACFYLAPNLAVRYGIIRSAESHHTSCGVGQEGRGTMLCTRVGSMILVNITGLPFTQSASPCPPDV
jgi:hypothetical protein